ncbi:TGB 1 protein [Euonymus yellow vein virus]|uniref:TGB 1 protein n=1 Tax=Euonymus yellow vein virus TaxID=2013968 RepID=A0A218MK52_9VIRU|nr:TGB 1 protein [Euonymus yellow vein virus]ASE06181.1 TGB 1 protein [Euonymus yellow vein virus]
MEVLTRLLNENRFLRTLEPISKPLVIHACAGAGKSTIIRSVLNSVPGARAYTFGKADKKNLSGQFIESACCHPKPEASFRILDEYLVSDDGEEYDAVFCDPLQVKGTARRPHFICTTSQRFGWHTADLLRKLGIELNSSKEDLVLIQPLFEGEPEGVILAWEPEVCALLDDHLVEFKKPSEVIGETFDCVSVITESLIDNVDFESLYVALSRHCEKLVVLSADPRDLLLISDASHSA